LVVQYSTFSSSSFFFETIRVDHQPTKKKRPFQKKQLLLSCFALMELELCVCHQQAKKQRPLYQKKKQASQTKKQRPLPQKNKQASQTKKQRPLPQKKKQASQTKKQRPLPSSSARELSNPKDFFCSIWHTF
jgi:hypothetical protein